MMKYMLLKSLIGIDFINEDIVDNIVDDSKSLFDKFKDPDLQKYLIIIGIVLLVLILLIVLLIKVKNHNLNKQFKDL